MQINPYEVLQVPTSATPLEVKKAYKKLSLQYHPDKIQQQNTDHDKEYFPKIQFAYSILSDATKRQRYDATGSLGFGASDDLDEFFDWKEYFQSTTEKISIEMIVEDRAKYQGSEEEKEDILHSFAYYEGDFLKLFEVIPHLEFDETQEMRVFEMVDAAVANGDIEADKGMMKLWEKYKKSRKTKVKQMLKKMAKEAQQAKTLAATIGRKQTKTEGDLKALIQKKNAGRLDDLISSLETKYVKKGKKRAVSDEEFDKIQQRMKKKV